MERFFGVQQDRLSAHLETIWNAVKPAIAEGVPPSGVRSFLSRLAPSLLFVYSSRMDGVSVPPGCFAALSAVITQGVSGHEELTAGLEALAEEDRTCADAVRAGNPAVADLDLGADDMLLVVQQARRLHRESLDRAESLSERDLGRMTLLDRVRTRLARPEIEKAEDEARDFWPATPASRRAVAVMVLEAARVRSKRIYQPIDPSSRATDPDYVAIPAAKSLLEMAASMSDIYTDEERDGLRKMIAKDGQDIVLSVDVIDEKDPYAYSWMGGHAAVG